MALKLNIREFITDYCEGLTDRDLLAKYKITAKEMVGLVRKLINDGRITKDQYFGRSRKIQDREAHQEKAFLKSLYDCPMCGHIQPFSFTVCPACGTNVSEVSDTSKCKPAMDGITVVEGLPERPPAFEHETDSVVEELPAKAPAEISAPVSMSEAVAAAETPISSEGVVVFSQTAVDMLGMRLEQITPVPEVDWDLQAENYEIKEIVTSGMQSAIFKAGSPSESAPPIAVKMFLPDSIPEDVLREVISRTIFYQSAMYDPNIVKILGSCILNGVPALLHEYVPTNLEMALQSEPEGLPLDVVIQLLPQIFNGLGYSHMHIGRDGAPARVPHLNLRLSKFLYDPAMKAVKLEGCGVWRALVDVRGFKRHLWEEPGADIAALPPESFVQESRFVNAFLVDIYQLGVALYRMVTGTAPFVGTNLEEYRFMHLRKFPIPPRVHRYTIPGWLDGMILKCLEKEPSKRWRSATQMELAIGKGLPE